MLISRPASGEGLNLWGANHCIQLEPHYNPQREIQAVSRIHRVGQTRPCYEHLIVANYPSALNMFIETIKEYHLETASMILTDQEET